MAFPRELHAAFPDSHPDWKKAIDLGIDVSLLLENLRLTPLNRLRQLENLLNETDRLRGWVISKGKNRGGRNDPL